MILLDLIRKTCADEKKIRQEHKILRSFQEKNPWLIEEALASMRTNKASKVPSFEEVISFKEDLLLNDFSKVYKQICTNNPLLIDKGEEVIFFYSISKTFYREQKKKGYQLGDTDDLGYLVSGSNLVIESAAVNLKDFLNMYYVIHN